MATPAVILVSAQIDPSRVEISAHHDTAKGRMRAARLAMSLAPIAQDVMWLRAGCDPIVVKQ